MAFRRRRRRAAVTWLPNVSYDNQKQQPVNTPIFSVPVAADGGVSTVAIPLVHDESGVANQETAGLAEYTQGGYILQRIIASVFIAYEQGTNETKPPWALVTAGFEILRIDANDLPLAGPTSFNYNSFYQGNERDPWIYERNFVLGNYNGSYSPTPGAEFVEAFHFNAPNSNFNFQSFHEGPFFDIKTKRRVGSEERLHLVISTWYPGDIANPAPVGDDHIWVIPRVRALATPIRTSNRRNASR